MLARLTRLRAVVSAFGAGVLSGLSRAQGLAGAALVTGGVWAMQGAPWAAVAGGAFLLLGAAGS